MIFTFWPGFHPGSEGSPVVSFDAAEAGTASEINLAVSLAAGAGLAGTEVRTTALTVGLGAAASFPIIPAGTTFSRTVVLGAGANMGAVSNPTLPGDLSTVAGLEAVLSLVQKVIQEDPLVLALEPLTVAPVLGTIQVPQTFPLDLAFTIPTLVPTNGAVPRLRCLRVEMRYWIEVMDVTDGLGD